MIQHALLKILLSVVKIEVLFATYTILLAKVLVQLRYCFGIQASVPEGRSVPALPDAIGLGFSIGFRV